MKELSINFATNMYGQLNPGLVQRIETLINNPCQSTWEDAYSIIINARKMTSLWNAVIAVDSTFPKSKMKNGEWSEIPSSETIKKAIRNCVYNDKNILN